MIGKTTYRVTRAEVDVHEDSWEHGEGDYCNGWFEESLEDEEYDTIEDLFKGIEHETYIFSADPKDYIFMEDEGRIDTDATVNVDNEVADKMELQMWKDGEVMLYNAHLMCWVEAIDTTYAGGEEVDSRTRPIDESDFVGFDINFG